MPDICMQHMCAVMLLDGTVSFKSSHDEKRMRDPQGARGPGEGSSLLGDDALTGAMPSRQGIVELELARRPAPAAPHQRRARHRRQSR